MRKFNYLIGLSFLGIVSCASFGTRVRVITPEVLPSLRTIAIWPIGAVPLTDRISATFPDAHDIALLMDPEFREHSERVSAFAESALLRELSASELFVLITPDSVFAVLSGEDPSYSRFKKLDWRDHRRLIDADGFLLTKMSFARESDGVNTYVTLTLYDGKTAREVIEVKFNSKWGKSYRLSQQIDKTIPDGVKGAVKGLVKKLRKYPSFNRREVSN